MEDIFQAPLLVYMDIQIPKYTLRSFLKMKAMTGYFEVMGSSPLLVVILS